VGTGPKRFGVSEWESLEKAQAWYTSAERKALDPLRSKAFKIVRQFIVEGPAN
jgi:heme-degrading monooxygenase HmoA